MKWTIITLSKWPVVTLSCSHLTILPSTIYAQTPQRTEFRHLIKFSNHWRVAQEETRRLWEENAGLHHALEEQSLNAQEELGELQAKYIALITENEGLLAQVQGFATPDQRDSISSRGKCSLNERSTKLVSLIQCIFFYYFEQIEILEHLGFIDVGVMVVVWLVKLFRSSLGLIWYSVGPLWILLYKAIP